MGERLFIGVGLALEVILLFILIQQIYTKHSLDAKGTWAKCLLQSLCKTSVLEASESCSLHPGSNHRERLWPHPLHAEAFWGVVLHGAAVAEAPLAESLRAAAQAKASCE